MRNQQKRRKEKRRQPSKTLSFFFFLSSFFVKTIYFSLSFALRKQFLWIKERFVDSKQFSLIQRNKFDYIKENFFESTELSSIQRNFFFDRISKKCFFNSKRLFSGCKKGRKKEKEGRDFGRLTSFFFSPFLLVSHNLWS